MGRIAMPSLIAQAAAPSIGAAVLQSVGLSGALAVFLATAAFNLMLVIGLLVVVSKCASPIEKSCMNEARLFRQMARRRLRQTSIRRSERAGER